MKTKELVEMALRNNPHLRDDDKELTLLIWAQQGLSLSAEQMKIFRSVSSMDFISRRRRELMSKYPPSKEADERRHTHFAEETERYSKSNWFTRRMSPEIVERKK